MESRPVWLLAAEVWIVRSLFGVVFRYDRIVARGIHHRLGSCGRRRRSSARHGHRHWHLLMLLLVLLWIGLLRVATSGGVVARHWLRHGLWHRVDSRSGGVLLHDDPGRCGRTRVVDMNRVRTYVVLGRCDYNRGGYHGTLVTSSLAAHPAQRKEHKQHEKYDDRNEDVHDGAALVDCSAELTTEEEPTKPSTYLRIQ